MKTLYIDYQYIAREIGGQPANWQLLTELLAANTDWRIAVSECNLLEIASEGEQGAGPTSSTLSGRFG